MSPKNRIFQKIKNLNIQKKIICIYALVYALFLLLLIMVLQSVLGTTLFEHESSMLRNTLEQSVSHLETQLNDVLNLSNMIQNNDDIISAVNIDYGTEYFQMYMSYANSIKPELNIYKYLFPEVSGICIYSSCGIFPNKDYVQDLSLLEEKEWYEQVKDSYSPVWVVSLSEEQPFLACVRKLPKNKVYPFDNYLCLEVDYESFFESTRTINTDEYGLLISDQNKTVYEYDSYETEIWKLDAEKLREAASDAEVQLGKNYLLLNTAVKFSGWNVCYYSPLKGIQENVSQTIFSVFILIALCFALLLLLTLYMINTLVSPLQQVTERISCLSLDDIEQVQVLQVSNSSKEITMLVDTFNSMLRRIQNLIKESYFRNLEVKEYQLKSLRAQINPHFLYNTLSSINARAIIAEQPEISKTVQLLSTFYRTALNKGQDITTIEDEIKNVQSYISLQLILTNHAFTVEYQLDEALFALPIPCLILQPIIENAIEHGLLSSRKDEKKLVLRLYQEEKLCCIVVWDNGCGISEEISDTIFSLERSHIGIKNVNERLKLSYGETMGLVIHSSGETGTEVMIRIPMED